MRGPRQGRLIAVLLALASACDGDTRSAAGSPRRDKPLDALGPDESAAFCKEIDAFTIHDAAYVRAVCSIAGFNLAEAGLATCEEGRDSCMAQQESSCRSADDEQAATLECERLTVGELLDCAKAVAAEFKRRYASVTCSDPSSAVLAQEAVSDWQEMLEEQPEACRALAASCPTLFSGGGALRPHPADAGVDGAPPTAREDASTSSDASANPDPFLCGGAYRDPCAADKYCAWGDGCGTVGNCRRRDRSCATQGAVCGCDGQTYESECAAGAKGVGLAHVGVCAAPAAQFRCGEFVCDGATYCLDASKNRSDPDQQRYLCLLLPAGCTTCACVDQLGRSCYSGATCASMGDHLNVVCK